MSQVVVITDENHILTKNTVSTDLAINIVMLELCIRAAIYQNEIVERTVIFNLN